jgi:hypothetical protein
VLTSSSCFTGILRVIGVEVFQCTGAHSCWGACAVSFPVEAILPFVEESDQDVLMRAAEYPPYAASVSQRTDSQGQSLAVGSVPRDSQ